MVRNLSKNTFNFFRKSKISSRKMKKFRSVFFNERIQISENRLAAVSERTTPVIKFKKKCRKSSRNSEPKVNRSLPTARYYIILGTAIGLPSLRKRGINQVSSRSETSPQEGGGSGFSTKSKFDPKIFACGALFLSSN